MDDLVLLPVVEEVVEANLELVELTVEASDFVM